MLVVSRCAMVGPRVETEEDIQDFLEEPPPVGGGQWAQRDAGGGRKVTTSDGVRLRVNPVNGQLSCTMCLTCGLVGNPRPCAGCRSAMYCSKACQAKDWPRHRNACKAMQKAFAEGHKPDSFNALKWLNAYPESASLLAKAFEDPSVILPLVVIRIGTNDARSIWHYPLLKTQEDIDSARQQLPEPLREMLRVEDGTQTTHLPSGKPVSGRRVTVVVEHPTGVQVLRARVSPPVCS